MRIVGDSVAGAWKADLMLDINSQSPGVAALWARARIADLLDRQRRGADAAVTKTAIVETALAHHLVSKYTSLVAVDKTPQRPAGVPLQSEQVANLMPYGQSGSAIFGFPATATSGPGLRLNGMLAIVAALLLLLMSALPGRKSHGLAC